MSRGGLFASGGRFTGSSSQIMQKFNESLSFDQRMWAEDLRGSKVYARGLQKCGLLTEDECQSILVGLDQVYAEWETESFVTQPSDEDIHTANERRLTELIGATGGKLHTGRSRNDQVATDTRLYTLKICREILSQDLNNFFTTGCDVASRDLDVIMAGYTHLQPAQPIRFSHWLMSHLVAIQRDAERLGQLIPRINMCPLGSGALAGNAFNIDREFLAKELGFDGVSANSLDSVCDRDFVLEVLMWAEFLLIHLSQFAEDLIVQNMLKCVEMDDAFATGSSLMPQKKNPDALELLRGKAGIMIGKATGFAATLKGLPRAYNKDLQEDKVPLFECLDTVRDCIAIATGVIATMKPKPDNLLKALSPEMLATDLADYLVRKGVPFRETHHISGAVVRLAEESNTPIDKLTLEDLQSVDTRFETDVMKVWDYEASVERKQSLGGTAKNRVKKQIDDCLAYAASLGSSHK